MHARPNPWPLLLLTFALCGPAQAQSVSNGQLLYTGNIVPGENSCATSACHGATPARKLNRIQAGFDAQVTKASFATVQDMRFLEGRVTDAQLNDLAAYIAASTGTVPIYLPTVPAAALSLAPRQIDFGSLSVGNTSVAHTVVLSNPGTAPLTLTRIQVAPADFALSHDCPLAPASLGVEGRCTLTLTFTPPAAGASPGTLTITSNAPVGTSAGGSPSNGTVNLAGRGVTGPAASLVWRPAGGALTFPATAVGSSSAAQTLSLVNVGSVPASIASLTSEGDQAGDFVLAGECIGVRVLAGGAQCALAVSARPQGLGARTAQLRVLSTDAGNPPTLALTATGNPAASPPNTPVTPDPASPGASGVSNSNIGAGGCSLLDPNQPIDPLLGVLLAGAAWVVWRQRSQSKSDVSEP